MASATADAVSVRDPLNESGDIDYLISLGPVQPTGTFNTTNVLVDGNIKRLRFQNSWFQGRPWLEYSSASDSACRTGRLCVDNLLVGRMYEVCCC